MTHKASTAKLCQDGICKYNTYNVRDQMVPSWHIYTKFMQLVIHHFDELYITNLP